ncbi:DUF2911 domain-containing protein [Siphonobacter sp. SORGH_AS_0500]|uniref:DUF2911 domain-containing protein n=1 Tax=Siphonobacter sp. SORGH_AS_0500 TaxID=1864824 RepID=UPI000CB8A6A1|nr:DUF2911 domain-containing protein [Siphonobacter sp. SORGH_AS_0500]MDR6194161.1 hypothetical protein [Siphonobacter sp. SORGH_AS_0500]PKK36959.1 hypothetical protein BWI96_08720 [Siphonobacter sp. SORGH_AS_0500]
MRKVLITLVVILTLTGTGYWSYKHYTKSFSQESHAQFNQAGLKVQVDYCQPAKKGRLIFGDSSKALVPYGKVWRTGANEATLLVINKDVSLAGKPLKAGEYTIWTIPGPKNWQVVINQETGQWGTEYDASKDLFRATVPAYQVPQSQELFEISFVPELDGTNMLLHWDHTEVRVPIRVQ